MLPEEWERIKLIFESALKLPESKRAAYIEAACANEPQQKAVVQDLLENHAAATHFLETAPVRLPHVFTQNDRVAERFRIVAHIGEGGMGEVYEAFDEKLRARVALKTLRPEFTSSSEALERFRREILIAREVSHENICRIFDLVEYTDSTGAIIPCLTMQLIAGESLMEFLRTRRPLSLEEARPLIRQIAGAIDALHGHGIVHRDLKPSNIMLTRRDGALRAMVTDFGLAKPLQHGEGSFFESKLDFHAGAPYFMAPELLRDGRPSPASDIYALGLIIDEMVTDTRAFPAESLHSLYYQKLWEAPISPSSRCPHLDERWNAAILQCLAPRPEDRYARAGEIVRDLEESAPAPVNPAPFTLEATQRGSRRWFGLPSFRRGRAAAMALLLLAIVAALAAAGSLAQPTLTSVVVFPIENLSNRPELDYLSRGIGAELMRRLTLLDGVQVIPFYELRGNAKLDRLKGRFSLEGMLQASGTHIRLNAQLIENRDGALIWSQDFDRELGNPLQLQSDIAEGSVEALKIRTHFGEPAGIAAASILLPRRLARLLGYEEAIVPRAATDNASAFDYYLRGRYLFEERTVPAALDAIRSYESALREDPAFALAKAALAEVQYVLMDYEYEPDAVLLARARQYAEDAIRMDPNLAEAYTALAAAQQGQGDLAGAEQSYKTGIRLSPRFAMAHRWYAGILMQFGRTEASLEEMRRAMELDPYDYSAESNNGLFLCYARRYREAAAELEDTLSHKDLISANRNLGDVYLELALQSSGAERQDYFARAIRQADLVEAAVRRGMAQSPSPSQPVTVKYADRMHAEEYTLSGRRDLARPYIERLAADTAAGRISPIAMAMFCSVTGDREQAMALLEKAAERKDRDLRFLRVDPQFEALATDSRFQALLMRLGVL